MLKSKIFSSILYIDICILIILYRLLHVFQVDALFFIEIKIIAIICSYSCKKKMTLSAPFPYVKPPVTCLKLKSFQTFVVVFFLVTLATVFIFHNFFVVQPLQCMTKNSLSGSSLHLSNGRQLYMSYLHVPILMLVIISITK